MSADTDRPDISIIVPHYDQAWALPHALAAIVRAMGAYGRDRCQLILVDDGTRGLGLRDLVELAPVGTVVMQHAANMGTAAAINTGTAMARGRRWTWQSSDNLVAPEWLTALSAPMDADPKVGAVYGGFWYDPMPTVAHARIALACGCDPSTSAQRMYAGAPWSWRQVDEEACRYGPALLIDAEVWRAAGGHSGRIAHDLFHWLRVEEVLQQTGRALAGVPAPLVHYIAHPARATVTRRAEYDAPAALAEARRRRGLA